MVPRSAAQCDVATAMLVVTISVMTNKKMLMKLKLRSRTGTSSTWDDANGTPR
jgi:hypothetical protein